MLQIVHFDEDIKNKILSIENKCEELCEIIEQQFQSTFHQFGIKLYVDLIRNYKGKKANKEQVFLTGYESFIEIGLVQDDEYFPNAYIPIWKCKGELFHQIGYLTRFDLINIEIKLKHILNEVHCECFEERT